MEQFHPVALNAPPQPLGQDWWRGVWEAWGCSKEGKALQAREMYEYADSLLDGFELNASLSVLRHNAGAGSGTVRPVPPTEDNVVTLFLPRMRSPAEYASCWVGHIPEDHFEKLITEFKGQHKTAQPHVMVMSTGRCGTVSLFKLFRESNLEAYHSYWFKAHSFNGSETLARLAANEYGDMSAAQEWATTRTAEGLGEKPMIGLNHADTVFAPVFAAIHENSKFVYLRRDPEKVFDSFIKKNQWSGGANCFLPVEYEAPFKFAVPYYANPADGIAWHIEFTERYARAFGRVMGDRFIEISSDKLFAQDEDEIGRLLEFTGSDIPLDQAKEHFTHKINEKKHKLIQPEKTNEAMHAMPLS